MLDLIFLLVLIVVTLGIAGYLRTLQIEQSPQQTIFAKGKVPKELPDGLYRGSSEGYGGSWHGKKFNRELATGINLFKAKETVQEKYAFKTYVGKGLKDTIQVIKIDYNLPNNPFWLRLILDEVVEVEPGKYLGKLHVNIVPGMPFTLAFFELNK